MKYKVGDIIIWPHKTVVAQIIKIQGSYYSYKFILHNNHNYINKITSYDAKYLEMDTRLITTEEKLELL